MVLTSIHNSENEIYKVLQFTRDIKLEGFGTLNVHYVTMNVVSSTTPSHFYPYMAISIFPMATSSQSVLHTRLYRALYIFIRYAYIAGYLSTFHAHVNVKAGHSIIRQMSLACFVNLQLLRRRYINYCTTVSALQPPTIIPPELSMALHHAYGHPLYHAREDWTATDRRVQITRQRPLASTDNTTADPWVFHCKLLVGLLAWIYKKLVAWADSYPWEPDDEGMLVQQFSLQSAHRCYIVLAWVSIYWFSRTGPAASLGIYEGDDGRS